MLRYVSLDGFLLWVGTCGGASLFCLWLFLLLYQWLSFGWSTFLFPSAVGDDGWVLHPCAFCGSWFPLLEFWVLSCFVPSVYGLFYKAWLWYVSGLQLVWKCEGGEVRKEDWPMKGWDLIMCSEGCISASIRMGREIRCLPYAGFFWVELVFWVLFWDFWSLRTYMLKSQLLQPAYRFIAMAKIAERFFVSNITSGEIHAKEIMEP